MEEAAARQFLHQEAKGLAGAKLSPVNFEAGEAGQYRAQQRKPRKIPEGTLPTPVSRLSSHSTEEKGQRQIFTQWLWMDRQTDGRRAIIFLCSLLSQERTWD